METGNVTEVPVGKDQYQDVPGMVQWCRDQFGSPNWKSYVRNGYERWGFDSAFGTTVFYFRDPRDAVMFTLKWK